MKQKSEPGKASQEQMLEEIRRQTRRQYSAEEKARIDDGQTDTLKKYVLHDKIDLTSSVMISEVML